MKNGNLQLFSKENQDYALKELKIESIQISLLLLFNFCEITVNITRLIVVRLEIRWR